MLAATTLTVMTACGSDEPAKDESVVEPPIDAAFKVANLKSFALPLDSYELSPEQYQAFTAARLSLVKQCMNRYGFEYPLPPLTPAFLGPNEKRYGLGDPKRAATVGYHDPEEDERNRVISAVQQGMTEKEEAVLNGLGTAAPGGEPVPKNGCNGESMTKLAGDGVDPNIDLAREMTNGLPQKLRHKAYLLARADSRVTKANAEWSACMKTKGLNYTDPVAGGSDVMSEKVSDAELAVATADVECKIKVDYINIRAAVETAYHEREIDSNKTALDAVKSRNESVLRQVAKVNSGRL